jgi:hypothetical protein
MITTRMRRRMGLKGVFDFLFFLVSLFLAFVPLYSLMGFCLFGSWGLFVTLSFIYWIWLICGVCFIGCVSNVGLKWGFEHCFKSFIEDFVICFCLVKCICIVCWVVYLPAKM